MKRSLKRKRTKSVNFELNNKNLPVETLEQLIENDMIQDEIPFELLADQYPSLLDKWYPGYPGFPRKMTTLDPISCQGVFKGGVLKVYDQEISLGTNAANEFPDGEYPVWIRRDANDNYFVHTVYESDDI